MEENTEQKPQKTIAEILETYSSAYKEDKEKQKSNEEAILTQLSNLETHSNTNWNEKCKENWSLIQYVQCFTII